ncbi:MAG: hypothetical protein DRJ40_02105 [Thermoprotei archaeon]|nr:MAG: hypothetical protein DRJ40_02105 [Thermoprotei archaeon]
MTRRSYIQLLIITATSPLPPISTITFLKKLGILNYIPSELSEIKLRKLNFHNKFIEVIKYIKEAQLLGSKQILRNKLEHELNELRIRSEVIAERTAMNLEIIFTLLFTAPLMISLILLFIPTLRPAIPYVFYTSLALSITVTAIVTASLIPLEYSTFENPPYTTYIPLVLTPAIYLVTRDPLLAILTSSIASLPQTVKYYRKSVDSFNEVVTLIEKLQVLPTASPIELGIEDVSKLLRYRAPITKALALTLYLTLLFRSTRSDASQLHQYATLLRKFITDLRIRLTYTAIYAVIALGLMTVAASIVLKVHTTLAHYSLQGPIPTPLPVLQPVDVNLVKELTTTLLTASAVVFSIVVALFRELNPMYFTLYLPTTAAVTWLCFTYGHYLVPIQ